MKSKFIKACFLFATITSLITGCGASDMSSENMVSQSAVSNTKSVNENFDGKGAVYYNTVQNEGVSDSSIASDAYSMEEDSYEVTQAATEEGDNQTQNLDSMTLLEEKLVYHCDMDIETLDYAKTMASIKNAITKYNGVIQAENESDNGRNWYYEDYYKTSGTLHNYIKVRIPSEKYENFLSELDGVGKIISKSTSVDNISQQYYDTTTQIEALQIQEKNLLSMLEKCETIEDMITVQSRLSEVQYELSSLQTNKRYMDIDVAYSYVNINVSEVMEYRQDVEPVKKNTFIDRLKNTLDATADDFLTFMEGFLFLIIHLAPYMVIVAIFCFVFRKKIKQKLADIKADKMAYRAQKEIQQQALIQQHQMMKNQAQMQQKTSDNKSEK